MQEDVKFVELCCAIAATAKTPTGRSARLSRAAIAKEVEPLYKSSDGKTGFVSIEVSPAIEDSAYASAMAQRAGRHDRFGMANPGNAQQMRHLATLAPNVLVKIPDSPGARGSDEIGGRGNREGKYQTECDARISPTAPLRSMSFSEATRGAIRGPGIAFCEPQRGLV